MPFTQFTAKDLTKKFGIKYKAEHFFDKKTLQKVKPTSWLEQTIERSLRIGFSSEKSRSERLVSPILTELSIQNDDIFTIYSGMIINADNSKGLNGVPIAIGSDFMLSFSKIQDFVTAPIFSITEAKKQDIEEGTIQCAAQLIAANMLNKEEGYDFPTLYGCSTTGTEWRFLKLEGNIITLDINRYFLAELDTLLGALQTMIDQSKSMYLKTSEK